MVASGLWFDADSGSEGDDAYSLGITWGSWAGTEDAAPQGLEVKQTSFIPLVRRHMYMPGPPGLRRPAPP